MRLCVALCGRQDDLAQCASSSLALGYRTLAAGFERLEHALTRGNGIAHWPDSRLRAIRW